MEWTPEDSSFPLIIVMLVGAIVLFSVLENYYNIDNTKQGSHWEGGTCSIFFHPPSQQGER